jgi:hypothetical protein
MHLIVFVLGLLVVAAPAHALQLAHLWHKQAGDASSQFAYDAAIDDATGRVAMTGYFGGSINFGGTTMTSAGSNDGFIVVFDAAGQFIAQRQFGGTGNQYGIALAWANDGHLVVTGHFAGTVNLGGSTLTSAGLNDIFLARFDYLLTHNQSSRFGDASEQFVSDLAIENSGNVALTGYFQGNLSFGGIGGGLTSLGGHDIFVAKLSSSFFPGWSSRFGDSGSNQYGQGVDVDGAGNVYLCGYFTGTVNFGGANLTSAGGNDIYVAKLSTSGVHQWSKVFGDAASQHAIKISAGSAGEVYVVGYFGGVVNFGGGALTSGGLDDIFLAKFSTTGAFQWASRFGDATSQFGLSVDNDDTHVYMSGQSSGNINFGTGGIHVGAGGRDIYVAKFTSAGAHVWSRIYGDSADQFGFGVDVGAGRLALAGYFQGGMTAGSTPITSAGGSDTILMVMSLNALEPVIKSVTDVRNDQGKKVRVRFERSGLDDPAFADPVLTYEAWVEEPFADTFGAARAGSWSPQGGGGELVYVGSIPARGERVYTMLVPTFVDSTIADGDYNTRLYIRAARSAPTSHHPSPLGIGSSIDNLAPGMEQLRFDLGLLHWNGSDAPDVDYYSVYGGASASFGSATLIDYTIDTQINMNSNPRAYYFVTATDFSGNEGEPEMLRVLTGTGNEPPPSYVLSISAYPNPFNPATTIRYTLPARDRVRIDIFDARGGLVRRLVDETRAAGAYTVSWDGTDASGVRAGSGIYFARITQRDGARSYKLVLLK